MWPFHKQDLEKGIRQFCERHWLRKMVVDEAKSKLTIVFWSSYPVPFSLNFLNEVKEIRFSGLVFPIDAVAFPHLIFPKEKSNDMIMILTIGEVITLDTVHKGGENGKEIIFVTKGGREYALKREPV